MLFVRSVQGEQTARRHRHQSTCMYKVVPAYLPAYLPAEKSHIGRVVAIAGVSEARIRNGTATTSGGKNGHDE